MSTTASIRAAANAAAAYLTEHPDEARYRDSHARARLVEGLTVDVEGPGGEMLRTDMPRGIGGTAHAPSPGWYLRAATASCIVALIGIRAAVLGLELDSVEVVVDSESDDRGILGLDASVDAGALALKIVATVRAAGADPATIDALIRWAVDHCPVSDTVRRAVPIELEIA